MKEDAFIDILRQVKAVLNECNIESWLDCGTLLGAVRDRKFLPWEHDIDLGAWNHCVSDDLKISVSNRLLDKGFNVYISHLVNHMNIRKGEVFIDINFYRLNNGKAIWPMLTNPVYIFLNYFSHVLSAPYEYKICMYKEESLAKRAIRKTAIEISRMIPSFLRKYISQVIETVCVNSDDVSWVIPASYFLNLKTIEFYGMELKVPAETKEYLAYRYGKDWQIPKRDWVTARDDGAISFRHKE